MDNETDGPQAGPEATAVAETSQVETPSTGASEDTAEQQTGADDAGQADEASETPKRKPWWEKRFDELTAKRYAAENEAAYWRGKAESSPGQATAAQPAQQGPPREEDFPDWDAFNRATIRYELKQEMLQERMQEQQATVARTYQERVAAVRDTLPDYDLYVGDPNLPITPLMASVIRESEVGPQVAYYLGKNPTEAKRIAGLSETRQAATLGRLEEKLTAEAEASAKPNPKPIPPAPPQTVAGLSAGLSKSLNDMSMSEYIAARKADKT